MFAENTEYEILTPTGWKEFKGITFSGEKITYRITLKNGKMVDATEAHFFFSNNIKIPVKDLKVSDFIDTVDGLIQIIDISERYKTGVYDIVEVEDELHRFIVNDGIVTKNCDEFAFVRPSIAELFWTSITPTLATGGKAIITSTPNSDEDQFALIWKQANKCQDEYGNETELGINGFKAYKAHWSEQPGRDNKWAKEMEAQLGPERFRREINCEFIIAEETLIAPATLVDLNGIEPISRMGQVRWYKRPEKGNIYTVALDPSLGTGSDPAAIQIYEANTTTQVGEWKHNKTDIPNQIKLLAQINKYIVECTNEPDSIYYSIENNSIGEAALISLNEYGESNIPGIFLSEPGKKRKGFTTTHKVKLTACAKFKTLVETKKLKINSKSLVSELKTFVALGGSYEAKVGETDDLVMSSLLTVRMFQVLGDYHYNLEERISDHEEFIQPLPFFAVLG
jgi:hypothetical protein